MIQHDLVPGTLCCVITDGMSLFLKPVHGMAKTGKLKEGDIFMILSQISQIDNVILGETVYLVISNTNLIGWTLWRGSHYMKSSDIQWLLLLERCVMLL